MYRRDNRFGVIPDRQVTVKVALQPVAVRDRVRSPGRAHLAQVVPGGKTAAFAPDGQHGRPGCLQRFERVTELVEKLTGQRIRMIRTVQHDPGKVLFMLDADMAVLRVLQVHEASLSTSALTLIKHSDQLDVNSKVEGERQASLDG